MLSENFPNGEWLYKAVKNNKPTLWSEEYNRPSSAIFKNSKGVSVDRIGDRDEDQVIKSFDSRFDLKAILKITAGQCREIGTYPKYVPKPDNIYHSEIHGSENEVKISGKKPNKLNLKAIENGIIYP